MPDEVMLIVECPSTVWYQNQVGGVVCYPGELEGVLAPVELSREAIERIQNLPYRQGREGLTAEIADSIDAVLAAEPRARSLKVDRSRLGDSWEAWVFVEIDSPESAAKHPPLYFGPIFGFGSARGVLTWINSD